MQSAEESAEGGVTIMFGLGDIGEVGIINPWSTRDADVTPAHYSMRGVGIGDLGDEIDVPFFGDPEPGGGVLSGSGPLAPGEVYAPIIQDGPVTLYGEGWELPQVGSSSPNNPSPNPGSGGVTPQQLASLLAAGAQGASAIYRATQSPSLVPGSSLVYNPQTGQLVPASGLSVGGLFGTSLSASGSLMPILLIGGAVLLFMTLGKR